MTRWTGTRRTGRWCGSTGWVAAVADTPSGMPDNRGRNRARLRRASRAVVYRTAKRRTCAAGGGRGVSRGRPGAGSAPGGRKRQRSLPEGPRPPAGSVRRSRIERGPIGRRPTEAAHGSAWRPRREPNPEGHRGSAPPDPCHPAPGGSLAAGQGAGGWRGWRGVPRRIRVVSRLGRTARSLRAACSAFTASTAHARRSLAPWRPLTRRRRRTRRPRRAAARRMKCPGCVPRMARTMGWIRWRRRLAPGRMDSRVRSAGHGAASGRRRRRHCCADRDGGVLLASRRGICGKAFSNNELRKWIRCRRRSFAPAKLPPIRQDGPRPSARAKLTRTNWLRSS